MAYIEGICKNCGSLIQVNPAKPEARCLFCWALTPTEEAQEILKADVKPTFPHAVIADAPSMDERMSCWRLEAGDNSPTNKAVKSKHNYDNIMRKENKDNDLSAVSRLKMMKCDLLQVPKVKLPTAIALALGLVILPLALLIALTVPGYLRCRAETAALFGKLDQLVDKSYLAENRTATDCLAVLNQDITNVRLVTGKALSEEEMRKLGADWYNACSQIKKDKVSQVKVQVISSKNSNELTVNSADDITVSPMTRTH